MAFWSGSLYCYRCEEKLQHRYCQACEDARPMAIRVSAIMFVVTPVVTLFLLFKEMGWLYDEVHGGFANVMVIFSALFGVGAHEIYLKYRKD